MKQTRQLVTSLSHFRRLLLGISKLFKPLKILIFSCLLASSINLHANEQGMLASLKSGNHFAIMRHALAPGSGDPSNFDLKDCSTQRNLSQTGIDQAVNIGKKLRDNGISEAQVFTSQWCRCIDTAEQLDLGMPVELPLINSFFQDRSEGPAQTHALKKWLMEQDLSKPLILVSHQVNITALTDVYPNSGEIIIVERLSNGEFIVTGRIQTN